MHRSFNTTIARTFPKNCSSSYDYCHVYLPTHLNEERSWIGNTSHEGEIADVWRTVYCDTGSTILFCRSVYLPVNISALHPTPANLPRNWIPVGRNSRITFKSKIGKKISKRHHIRYCCWGVFRTRTHRNLKFQDLKRYSSVPSLISPSIENNLT